MKKKPKILEAQKAEIEFLPVQNMKSFGDQLESIKQVAKRGELPSTWGSLNFDEFKEAKDRVSSTNEFLRTMLPKGKYDIDYVINLLGIIIDNCGPLSSILGIKESCKKLQGYLKVEKCPRHEDARILITCDKCRESVVLPKSISDQWKCPCTKNTKLLD